VEDAVASSKLVQPLPDQIAGRVVCVDFPDYLSKVSEVANRLCLFRIDQALKSNESAATGGRNRSSTDCDIQARLRLGKGRKPRRKGQQSRSLSNAGKAHIDLQIKMLGAIPAQARGEFLGELADHARKYPTSGRYLRNLADKGNDLAQEILARMSAE
jgi:hypothetical protein